MAEAHPGNSALLIIDMINHFDFPDAQSLEASAMAAARRIKRLKRAFRDQGVPVIYANDNFAHWQSDFRELVAICCGAGGTAQRVAELVKPDAGDYFILKPKHSAFLATPLSVLLAKLGVGTLYLTGMSVESCVLATAIDANAREYRVRLVREAVAGTVRGKHHALDVIDQSRAAEVISCRTAIGALRRMPSPRD